MDAGNPHRQHQFFGSDSDEILLFSLGPNGEVQISSNDEGVPQPAAEPYVIASDESQLSTIDPGPPLTISIPIITQVSPMATDSPITLSQDLLSQSEGGGASKSPSTTTTVYAETISSPSPSTQPTSSTVTVTVYPSSGSQRMTFSAGATVLSRSTSSLMSSSRTVLVSATSTSLYISSTISSSRSTSMTTISYSSSSVQTIVISSSMISSSVFTSSSFSSLSSRNSSAIATSTSTDQTPTETVTAPPLPGTGSNLNVHSPPYYVGIVFGTIAGIALLAALIAWWIRLQSHARRRRSERTLVPWARPGDDDDGGLEAGHGRHDLTNLQAWTPRGDRDVGEPKRSESYLNGSTWSLHNHNIPGHNLFSAESFGALSSIDGYTPAGVRHNHPQRHLPAHLMDEDGLYSNNRGRQLCVVNNVPSSLTPSYISPDESIVKARDSGLSHDVSWNQKPPDARRTMAERLRNLGKPPAEAPWEELGPLPTPGGTGVRPGNEAWASSIKSSLVNAFNAVAANLATPGSAPQMSKDDKLIVPPTRATTKSIRDSTIWDEKSPDLHRHDSLSTVTSKAWTLEDTGNGAGIVHLRMSDSDMLPKVPQRPSMPAPNLSFGDGDSISTYSERDSVFRRIPTRESQVPLVASSKPLPAHVKSDNYFTRRISSETIPANQVSRNSTIRSTTSTTRSRRGNSLKGLSFADMPRMPPAVDVPGPSVRGLKRGDSAKDSVVIEPDTISRLSSTDTSLMASTMDGHGERSEMAAASRALKDRKRRASQGLID